jgi:hypothetical protein
MSTPSAILQRGTWSHEMVSCDFRRSPIYSKQACSTLFHLSSLLTLVTGERMLAAVLLFSVQLIGGCLQAHPSRTHCMPPFFAALLDYQNTPSADIYGLIRFGRFRPWNDWESFKQYIVRSLAFWAFCFSSSSRQRCNKRMRRLQVSKPPVLI